MSPPRSRSESSPVEYDPVFLHSRREAAIIFGVWIVALVWAVPYCYLNGYLDSGARVDPESLRTVWGIPSWVFWGIAVPWLAADVFTIWFCFCYMQDDDLGEEREDSRMEDRESRIEPDGSASDRNSRSSIVDPRQDFEETV